MCAGNMLPGGIVYHCDTSSMITSCAVLVSHSQTATFLLCGGRKSSGTLHRNLGGLGREAIVFYSRLADLLSRKHSTSYAKTLSLLRGSISFSLLRSAILVIRGSRTIQRVEHPYTSAELRLAEAHLDSSG